MMDDDGDDNFANLREFDEVHDLIPPDAPALSSSSSSSYSSASSSSATISSSSTSKNTKDNPGEATGMEPIQCGKHALIQHSFRSLDERGALVVSKRIGDVREGLEENCLFD